MFAAVKAIFSNIMTDESIETKSKSQNNGKNGKSGNNGKNMFVTAIAQMWENKCKMNAPAKQPIDLPQSLKCFYCVVKSEIDIYSYLYRIVKHCYCTQADLIASLILVDRLCSYKKKLKVNYLNVHRLILVSILIAFKYNHDGYYIINPYFKKAGGVSLQELNRIELEFVFLLSFDLFTSHDVFNKYKKEVYLIVKK